MNNLLSLNQEKTFIKPIEFYPEWIQNLYALNKPFKKEFSGYSFIKQFYKSLGLSICYDAYKIQVASYDEKTNQASLQWIEVNKDNGTYTDKSGKTIYKFKSIKSLIIELEKTPLKKINKKAKNFIDNFSHCLTSDNLQTLYKNNNSNFALSMNQYTNVARIDIDAHISILLAKMALKKLCEILDYPEMLIEHSLANGGYHLYIPFDHIIYKEHLDKFILKINNELNELLEESNNYKFIENPKYLRVPNTAQYAICKIQSKKELLEFIENDTCSYITEYHDMYNYFINLKKSDINLIWSYIELSEQNKTEIKQEDIYIIPFSRNGSCKEYLQKKYDNIKIGRGNRHGQYESKVSYGHKLNLDTTQILKDIRTADSGSYDLSKMSDEKLLEDIRRLYNLFDNTINQQNCKRNINKFQSNADLVPHKIKTSCDEFIHQVISKAGYITNKRKNDIFMETKKFFFEILGIFNYDENNPKQLISSYLSLNTDKNISNFSNKFFELYKQHYKIDKYTIDLKKIFKAIITTPELFESHEYIVNNKKVTFLYKQFKACKAYSYKGLDNVYNFLFSLKNRFSYIKKSFNKDEFYIMNIYYILLDYYIETSTLKNDVFDYNTT